MYIFPLSISPCTRGYIDTLVRDIDDAEAGGMNTITQLINLFVIAISYSLAITHNNIFIGIFVILNLFPFLYFDTSGRRSCHIIGCWGNLSQIMCAMLILNFIIALLKFLYLNGEDSSTSFIPAIHLGIKIYFACCLIVSFKLYSSGTTYYNSNIIIIMSLVAVHLLGQYYQSLYLLNAYKITLILYSIGKYIEFAMKMEILAIPMIYCGLIFIHGSLLRLLQIL